MAESVQRWALSIYSLVLLFYVRAGPLLGAWGKCLKLRSIQVLRGVAACGVVLLHSYPVGARGAAGVDLFFVISGFIMATIPKRSSFLFDRFWRIFPLWWIALALWWAFNPPVNVLASLTLWPLSNGAMTSPALSVGWTLSFELLFYCAVALSLRIGVKALLAMFGLMLAGAVLTRAPVFNFLGNPMIFEFLFGAGIARLVSAAESYKHGGSAYYPAENITDYLSQSRRFVNPVPHAPRLAQFARATKPIALLIFAFVCLAFSPTWVYPPEFAMRAPASAWRVLYWGIPAAMIVYACLSMEKLFTRRWWGLAVLLGDASYSIYLFHLISLHFIGGIVGAFVAVAFGIAMWWLVERRIIESKPHFVRLSPLAMR